MSTILRRPAPTVCLLFVLLSGGCTALSTQNLGLQNNEIPMEFGPAPPVLDGQGTLIETAGPPAELAKVSLPTYRIEPPDVLLIDALRMVPKDPYLLKTFDVVQVVVLGAPVEQPIAGPYQIESSGEVNLGPGYGKVKVTGLSVLEATEAIREHLAQLLQDTDVSVSVLQMAGQQEIIGQHLVGPDGTVNLGIYGSVYLAGMTLDEARVAIEHRLGEYLDKPKVSVDVLAYNSKVYYIISEGAGFGDSVVRLPITGNETALDALALVGGLQQFSSKKIWISRPAPSGVGCDQILPIDWQAITKGASTSTNYQVLPGDRIFVAEDRILALDSMIRKVTQPFERILGPILLGTQTAQTIQRFPTGSFTGL